MNNPYGIVIVSHSADVAKGIVSILWEVAKDVPITFAGGSETGGIGTSFDAILHAFTSNRAEKILAFYDLGSAKMNIEMVIDICEKEIILYDVAVLEGAYVAAALLQVDVPIETIELDLAKLKIK